MANREGISMSWDAAGWEGGLNALKGPVVESLLSMMGVEAGVLLRDSAKANAMRAENKENVPRRGLLASSIYLAREKEKDGPLTVNYRVRWNHTIAPHGWLVEFGHIGRYLIYKDKNGQWKTNTKVELDKPIMVPAKPFLRPAWDNNKQYLVQVMVERGRKELPALIAKYGAK